MAKDLVPWMCAMAIGIVAIDYRENTFLSQILDQLDNSTNLASPALQSNINGLRIWTWLHWSVVAAAVGMLCRRYRLLAWPGRVLEGATALTFVSSMASVPQHILCPLAIATSAVLTICIAGLVCVIAHRSARRVHGRSAFFKPAEQ